MAYQETTRQSYGSKVKGSFQGILWGIILIIAGTIVLWWNEGRAVKASDALKDFQKNYVEMPDITTVNPEFEGKAIHATGVATTEDILRDATFGIAVNAFRLCRDVEYYQWEEHSSSVSKDKLGGATETTTTYTYEPAWSSEPVNSAEFKDPDYKGKNFVWRVVEDNDQYAANATFGAYRLTDGIIASISGEEPVQPNLTEEQKQQLLARVSDSTVVVTVTGNQVYIGADPDTPHIGDVRITFNQVTSPKTISLLQKVVNGTFESYIAKNGKAFSKVEMGTASAMNMIENQKSANKFMLWMLRLLGAILVIAGFRGLLTFISTVFAVVPFVQKIIGTGIGLVTTVIGIIWSIVVIALAWVAHRPVLAICLLAIAVALTVWLVMRSRKKKMTDVAALLAICLMVGIAGCTGTQAKGGDIDVASSGVKGPVKTVTVTQYYGEGEPSCTVYQYDAKGNVVSEKEVNLFPDEEYGIIENQSVKDAQGRYTKEVWGSPDGEVQSITRYEYDDQGRTTLSEYSAADGTVMSTTRNNYNAAGQLISSSTQGSYGIYTNENQYNEDGKMVKSVSAFNGEPSNITVYSYDEQGRETVREETLPSTGRVFTYYTSYDAKGEPVANTTAVTENGKTWINYRDSSFIDKNGLRHQRTYANYENDERTFESTFNKQGFVTHYEYFDGNASQPSIVADLSYMNDGTTLKEFVWKNMMLGQVQDTRSKTFSSREDTFGNWTYRHQGLTYNVDAKYMDFETVLGEMSSTTREIVYRGEDQGQNYGFEGKAGQADVRLTCTNDDDVLYGELTIDGNEWPAVGIWEENDDLHFVSLEEDGTIIWTLDIPAGTGKREATLWKGNSQVAVTLTPTRKDLKTYSFSAKPDDLVGIYQFTYAGEKGSGILDVWRGGENWENLIISVKCTGPAPSFNTAQDEFTDYLGNNTSFYRFMWDDETEAQLEYIVRFFDTFAVIIVQRGNTNTFFGLNATVAGVYAKLPSVG